MSLYMKNILICDDHPICQIGLETSLRRVLGGQIQVRHASSGQSLLTQVEEQAPDLICLDLNLPDASGVQFIPRLHEVAPQAKIMIITGSDKSTLLNFALSTHVNALISKSYSLEGISEALAEVMKDQGGETFLDPTMQQLLQKNESEKLTPREWEVIHLIAQGCTNRDIAEKLKCSIETVKTHRMNLGQKISARNRSELTAWYLQRQMNLDQGSNIKS